MYEKLNISFINRRLKEFVGGLDDSVSEVIEKAEIPRATLYSMFKDGGTIKHQNLVALKIHYGLDIDTLFSFPQEYSKNHNVPENETHVIREPQDSLDDDEFYTIPFYPNVKASAGAGLVPQEGKPPLQVAFRKYYITEVLQCQASDLVMINATGDSMIPDIHDGDAILIDESRKKPQGKINVVRIDNEVNVKYIQELPGNRYRVMSKSEAYDSFEIDADNEGFEILGQVVWRAESLV